MFALPVLLSTTAAFFHICTAQLLPNVNATFGKSPAPFTLDVDRIFVEQTRLRVRFARAPIEVDGVQPPGSDGPPLSNFTTLQEYWVNSYDWQSVQARINAK